MDVAKRKVRARRILVVDAQAEEANSLARLLRYQGHFVRTAHNAEQALEIGAHFLPEVLLLSFSPSSPAALELGREVRRRPWGHNSRLVALDAIAAPPPDAGFDAGINRPFRPQELHALFS